MIVKTFTIIISAIGLASIIVLLLDIHYIPAGKEYVSWDSTALWILTILCLYTVVYKLCF